MNKRQFSFLMLLLSVAACSEDEIPDQRVVFEGTYRLQEFQFTYAHLLYDSITYDSTYAMTTGPRIRLKATGSLQNKMEIDFEELIEDLIIRVTPQFIGDVRVESKYPIMITLTGNTFVLEEARFNLIAIDGTDTVLARSNITLAGQLEHDQLQLDFEVMVGRTESSARFSGGATGLREP